MIIFWRLLLSHLLSDFTLQINVVNALKRKHITGMFIHCLTHFVVALALTQNYINDVWFSVGAFKFTGWYALTVMIVSHFIIDELRVYSFQKMNYPDGIVSFLVDQLLHIYVLFMISPPAFQAGGFFIAEKWIALPAMFVMVTHATTVFIYFLEKSFYNKKFPGFDEKYFLMFERLVLWALFLVPGWWWTLFAALWAAQFFYIRKKRIMDLTLINIAASLTVTTALGFWTRYIYYGTL